MNKSELIKLLSDIADAIEENKLYLTKLDTEIGDGDHGINMARGFNKVKASLDEYEELSVSEILINCGKTLIKEIAGSSGPLYGSAFKCAGKVIGEKDNICLCDFTEMLRSGIERIMQLGRAVEGEKTMLDAMLPALRALEGKNDAKNALADAVNEANKAVEHTKEIIATKGRASYVGERSIGHQDPGATSFALILSVIAKAVA